MGTVAEAGANGAISYYRNLSIGALRVVGDGSVCQGAEFEASLAGRELSVEVCSGFPKRGCVEFARGARRERNSERDPIRP